jgi:serine/threonine-protein kinase
MDPKRFTRIQALFEEAADLPEAERLTFLNNACDNDEDKSIVLAMLKEDARDDAILDSDVAHVAYQMFGEISPASFSPQEFGPYRLIKKLAEGGMGVVFLAERDDLHNQVAIKILPHASFSPARRERFASEQQMLAHLNHRFIAHLHDADILADGTPWFAMEYVDGVKITDYCKDRPIEECLELFRSVCEAVQYAHGQLVIHRDLKPSNILVKADVDGAAVKLLDFGIAKQLSVLGDSADLTLTGFRPMTLSYAAPEQIKGSVGFHTDVYSLGVILYELLAGRPPFDISNQTPGEVERMIIETEPEKPSSVARRVKEPGSTLRAPRNGSWADLDVLCLTAMHKDQERRYRSVEALIRDINHYLNSEPLEVRPDALGYKLGKFVRRNRRAVSAAAIVFIVVVGLVVFFTIRLAVARNAALTAAARTQRIQSFMLNLFAGGDKQAGPSEDLRVVTLIDRGVQQAQTLDHEPEVQAALYHTLGTSYQNLGIFDKADSLLSAALDRRKMLLGADHPQVAESLVALGLLRIDQARLDEAEQLIREGLEKTGRINPSDNPATASAKTALGKLHNARGNYDEAIRVLDESVKLQSEPAPPTPELAASLTQLAEAHFYISHYDISDMLNRRVLSIDRYLFGDRHISIAKDLMNLGAIQLQWGRYKEAEQLYKQALEITQSWYRKDHPEVASNLTQLAQTLIPQERYDEAEKLLKQALDINELAYPPTHPRVAFALNELGIVALRRGNLDDAEARLLRVAELNRAVYGDDHFRTITAMSNLASVYVKRKDFARAETILREVVERYAKISPDHWNTGLARIKLGRTLVQQQRYQEAEAQILAGYEIAMKQTNPSVSWLQEARKDLVAIYEALHEPEKAAKFR